ncbi:Myosin-binding protein 1 [Zea mays]|uniref:Myosin-binding protein 1 n=1 Tax=Zea mays TaxID=4577 RepID=A0A317Y3V1_MAIZE|nr:Myosin-binding protein 1 [Zea mays]
MAAKDGSGSQDQGHRLWPVLSYACGELCVIMLLYVAAFASHAATRLARICGLRPPCILCTRLDRALHGNLPWFSADLVCSVHRCEVSSLAHCKSHGRLARSGDLCKSCLLSCTAVGAREEVVNSRPTTSSSRLCSCCSDPFKNNTGDTQRHSGAANAVVSWDSVPADHPNEKTSVVSIEEVQESDGPTKDSAAPSANGGAAKNNHRSAAPTRIAVDSNGSVKNASVVARANLTSPRPSEIISARDSSSTTQQEVKALLSQMSYARGGLDSSSIEGSPDAPNEEGNATSNKSPYLERNYCVLEPSDGSLADDVEGGSSLENVKRQLELNRKAMAALHKELEEERSASAVAASQTMAMINRLQEEKAAMQMEALQHLRMMEQQADHDHLAIQDLHDLLTEREKELLDLDAELAHCRRLLQNDDPFNGDRFDGTDYTTNNNTDFVGSAMSHFEDDKAYILESLSRLEENLGISTIRLASGDARNCQEDVLFEDQARADASPSSCDESSGVASLKIQISLLNIRLRALEEDQEFLNQVLSSLQCGSDGLQCIQEISRHLAELRRVVAH